MSQQQADVLELTPVQRLNPHVKTITDDDIERAEKGTIEHLEDVDQQAKALANFQYNAEEDETKPRKGIARFYRTNPSVDFMREVAVANTQELDPAEVKKVERKLYWLIVPFLAVDYAFYYIDKTTLSYAALFGIKKDLSLGGEDYSNLSSIFYIGWLVWAVPGNLLLGKFPLAKYLAVNASLILSLYLSRTLITASLLPWALDMNTDHDSQIFLWGVFLAAQAGSTTYRDMLALRFVSGMFEAVSDPCFVAMTGMWFTRRQQPTVIGLWYMANGVGIACGGLIGYGIGHIKGHLPSWSYEFLIVGIACSLWAVVMGIVIPDSPYQSRWLTRREAVVTISRKRHDHASVDKRQLRWEQVWETARDPKTYLYFCLGFFANVPNGATSNFGTLVVEGFGFDTLGTSLLQIPYGTYIALSIAVAIYVSHVTHALGIRTYLMAGVTVLTVVGFAMVVFTHGTAPRLVGYYLTGSSNAVFVLALSLISGNVGGTTKKLLASAAIFLGMSTGNIVGPYSFLSSEAPVYRTGLIVCMTSRLAEIVVILALRAYFVLANNNRDRKFRAGDERYDPNVQVYEDVTDKKNLHFRYVC